MTENSCVSASKGHYSSELTSLAIPVVKVVQFAEERLQWVRWDAKQMKKPGAAWYLQKNLP
jgi:hypothetical protein